MTEAKTYEYKRGAITYRLTPQGPTNLNYEVWQSNRPDRTLYIPSQIIDLIVKDRLRELVSAKMLTALAALGL